MRRKIAIFDVLGVRTEDDFPKIRAAWRRRVRELHPDVATDKEKSGKLLAHINSAYGDLQDHTPFADRRRGNRRKTWRSGRVWSRAERARKLAARPDPETVERARRDAEASKRKQAAEAARRREQMEALARRNAAELEKKEAFARAAAKARRAAVNVPISKEEQAMRLAAAKAYDTARSAFSI